MGKFSNILDMGGRSVIARDILSRRKFKVGIPGKKLSIKHGKVILKPKRRGRMYVGDATAEGGITAGTGKKERILSMDFSEFGNFMAGGIPGLYEAMLKAMVLAHNNMYTWVKIHERKRIPEETGALRGSLMRSLAMNKNLIKTENRLIMEIGTSIPYFVIVNEMETNPIDNKGPHLRHPPYVGNYRKGKRSRKPLYDPWALKHFFNFLVINSRAAARRIMNAAIRTEIYDRFKSFFGWTRLTQATALFRIRTGNP